MAQGFVSRVIAAICEAYRRHSLTNSDPPLDLHSIHDYGPSGRNRANAGKRDGHQSVNPKNEENLNSRQPSHAQTDFKRLSKRSTSPIESEGRRNFYPITWRVIGGGVLIGGHRKSLSLLTS